MSYYCMLSKCVLPNVLGLPGFFRWAAVGCSGRAQVTSPYLIGFAGGSAGARLHTSAFVCVPWGGACAALGMSRCFHESLNLTSPILQIVLAAELQTGYQAACDTATPLISKLHQAFPQRLSAALFTTLQYKAKIVTLLSSKLHESICGLVAS